MNAVTKLQSPTTIVAYQRLGRASHACELRWNNGESSHMQVFMTEVSYYTSGRSEETYTEDLSGLSGSH
jgi:hypothetical protein